MNNHFERLEKLYNSLETLKEEGLELDQNVIEKIQKIEESIITDEIVPLVAETIEPIIKNIRRELLILIEYKPGEDLAVKLTKKRSIIIPPENERRTTIQRETSFRVAMNSKGPKTYLEVKFPDGSVIDDPNGAETFARTIVKIGVDKVKQLGMICNGYDFISRENVPAPYTAKFANGYYIQTTLSNVAKKKKLEEISDRLKLGLQITIHKN